MRQSLLGVWAAVVLSQTALFGQAAPARPEFEVASIKPSSPDEFSRHLARNTQLILKQEAWLNRSVDASGGSYYIETLTDTLCRDWKHMLRPEGACYPAATTLRLGEGSCRDLAALYRTRFWQVFP